MLAWQRQMMMMEGGREGGRVAGWGEGEGEGTCMERWSGCCSGVEGGREEEEGEGVDDDGGKMRREW